MTVIRQEDVAGEQLAAKTLMPEWRLEREPVDYAEALEAMDRRAAQIYEGSAPELVWLLEHPPVYTAGTSARPQDLLTPRFPVHQTGRGGQYTYHGPGQRVAYVQLDLKRRQAMDIRQYVCNLEEWAICSLDSFGVKAERRTGRIGLWVRAGDKEAKIAAIGVRVRRWVTLHGVAINVAPDLSHFEGIVPCGISEHGVTSLAALGVKASLQEVDAALKETWNSVF
jgi:lipoyl(octanoyl) transferase